METEQIGAPLLQVEEPNRFIISRFYPVTWYKVKTDFAALARMRWVEGESTQNLARFFQIAEDTIKGYLRQIRQNKTLMGLGLEDGELKAIYQALKKEEHGKSNRIYL